MIAIVDYGMGNLRSVKKAFESLGFLPTVTRNPEETLNSDGLVLPGVGAFGDCMKNLEDFGLVDPIKSFINTGKPFLGICLGLQLLFEESEESPDVKGLRILKGKVIRFPRFDEERLKVPHMGWNQVEVERTLSVLKGIPGGSWFYFVHSYFPEPEDSSVIAGKTQYGIEFTSAIEKDNVFACQFHPEKSSTLGLRILENFAVMCGEERRQ
ncbi:MAG: Imidazole glycerol phosphate synthase subunit HisH [Candidatus Dadabacteria bacterium]|jgi:glutamine amidotransferase|nr:Imidazole glycerol phosphate synthase subunit HisH [Candidatus Dadabacteria bacterium]